MKKTFFLVAAFCAVAVAKAQHIDMMMMDRPDAYAPIGILSNGGCPHPPFIFSVGADTDR